MLTKDCFFYWIHAQATVGYYSGTEGKFWLKFAADALFTFRLIYSLYNRIASLFKLNWKNSETTLSRGLKILIQEKENALFSLWFVIADRSSAFRLGLTYMYSTGI